MPTVIPIAVAPRTDNRLYGLARTSFGMDFAILWPITPQVFPSGSGRARMSFGESQEVDERQQHDNSVAATLPFY